MTFLSPAKSIPDDIPTGDSGLHQSVTSFGPLILPWSSSQYRAAFPLRLGNSGLSFWWRDCMPLWSLGGPGTMFPLSNQTYSIWKACEPEMSPSPCEPGPWTVSMLCRTPCDNLRSSPARRGSDHFRKLSISIQRGRVVAELACGGNRS